jgi:hypothetical protein
MTSTGQWEHQAKPVKKTRPACRRPRQAGCSAGTTDGGSGIFSRARKAARSSARFDGTTSSRSQLDNFSSRCKLGADARW